MVKVEKAQEEAKEHEEEDDEGQPGCCLKACVILLVIVFLLGVASAAYWVVKYADKEELANDVTAPTDGDTDPVVDPAGP